jgi:hypothetical protein
LLRAGAPLATWSGPVAAKLFRRGRRLSYKWRDAGPVADPDEVVVRLAAVERDLAAMKVDCASTQLRLDNMDRRIERIERRLSLIEA